MSFEQASIEEFALPPESVQYAVRYMEEDMKGEKLFNNSEYPQLVATRLLEQYYIDSLDQFEEGLRLLSSKIYFIALPVDLLSEKDQTRVHFPWNKEDKPDYFLQVELEGSQKYKNKLGILKVTPQENLIRLKTTGILGPRSEEL